MSASIAAPWFSLLELRQRIDARGTLTFGEIGSELPFEVRRLFLLHDVAPSAPRGHHAHRALHQFLLMVSGACKVTVDNGAYRETLTLDGPSNGLYVPPMLWLELNDFSAGAVCLVLASDRYDEADYLRDHAEFSALAAAWR